MTCSWARVQFNTRRACHYAKMSGKFGRNIDGTLRPRWKISGKTCPPLEVVLFDQSVWYDRNLSFHFQKFSFPVPLYREVIEISVETCMERHGPVRNLFLSNNIVPFCFGQFHWFLTGSSGIKENTLNVRHSKIFKGFRIAKREVFWLCN